MTDEVVDLAKIRGEAHPQRSERFYDDPNTEDQIGAAGEFAFAKAFGLEVDWASRPGGDSGVDFVVQINGFTRTIDVKTYRIPHHLLVKVSEMPKCAHILVLCHYDFGMVSMIGWEHRSIMEMTKTHDFGKGIVSHFRLRDQLRPMDQLANLLAMK